LDVGFFATGMARYLRVPYARTVITVTDLATSSIITTGTAATTIVLAAFTFSPRYAGL
jgi:hypothetical protein